MFTVIDIIEPDFGCEGLPDGQELCCEVVLSDSVQQITVQVPDSELYEKGIDILSVVSYENGVMEKIQ